MRFMEIWTQRVPCKVNVTPGGSCKYKRNGSRAKLHGTRCVQLSWTSEKWNSSLIFTLCFYIVFVHYLWNFDLNLANKQRRKVIIRCVWLLRSTAVTMTWRQSNVTSANQLLHLSMTSLTRNVAWTSVVHGCMNLVVPKQVHLRKVLASVNLRICSSMTVKKKKKKRKKKCNKTLEGSYTVKIILRMSF